MKRLLTNPRLAGSAIGAKLALQTALLALAFTAHAQRTLYWAGGNKVDRTDGIAPPKSYVDLSGVWDLETKNWSVDAAGTEYVAWTNGPGMVAVFPAFTEAGDSSNMAIITLTEDITLNGIRVTHNSASWHRYRVKTDPGIYKKITLAGDKPEIWLGNFSQYNTLDLLERVELVAPDGFAKTSTGNLHMLEKSDNIGGTVTMTGTSNDGAGIVIYNTGSMNGVKEFVLWSAGHLNVTLAANQNNKLHDNAVLKMSYPSYFSPNGPAGSTEELRQIVLNACGTVMLKNSAAGLYTLTDSNAGIHRGPDGRGTLFIFVQSAGVFRPGLAVGHGVTPGKLLPWATTYCAHPAQLDAQKRFAIWPVDAPDANLLLWETNKAYRIETTAAAPFVPVNAITNLSIQSLGYFYNGANAANTLTLPIKDSHTLDIASGQISVGQEQWYTITLKFLGGRLTSSSGELYVMGGRGSDPTFDSAIIGEGMDLILTSPFATFTGTNDNTYSGTTYINGGEVRNSKATPYVSFPGDIVINRNAKLITYNANPAILNGNITIREGGRLEVGWNHRQDFNGALRFENGVMWFSGQSQMWMLKSNGPGIMFANGGEIYHYYDSGSSPGYPKKFLLFTDVLYEAASTNQAFIRTVNMPDWHLQCMNLSDNTCPNPVTRTFTVNDSIALAPGVPELTVDMYLNTDGFNVDFIKDGGGALAFEKISGLCHGTVTVEKGTLLFNAYATQTVAQVSTSSIQATDLTMDSTAGLRVGQLFTAPGMRAATFYVARILNATTVRLNNWPWQNATVATATFAVCGPFGKANLLVKPSGTLGGIGGHAGNVVIEGTLAPNDTFHIGGNLNFQPGATWQVDADATGDACDIVHVAGDITLDGECVPNFLNSVKRPVNRVWTIATFGGSVAGRMTVPQPGCSVRVNAAKKTVELHSVEAGTLFLVR